MAKYQNKQKRRDPRQGNDEPAALDRIAQKHMDVSVPFTEVSLMIE